MDSPKYFRVAIYINVYMYLCQQGILYLSRNRKKLDVSSEAGYLNFGLKHERKFYHIEVWALGYKTLFMLNLTEHEISTANKKLKYRQTK